MSEEQMQQVEEFKRGLLDESRFQTTHPNGHSIKRSETLGKLVAALAKAQLDFKAVIKDAENPGFMRGGKAAKYATLDSVVSATREALAKNGLIIAALPQEMLDEKRLRMTSMLIHESDEYIESTMVMTAVDRVTPQEFGKLMTYCRKYQWAALVGVAPEDDTDGNEASGVGSVAAAQAVAERKKADYKKAKETGMVPSLLWSFDPDDPEQLFYVSGDRNLAQQHKDILMKKGRGTIHKDTGFISYTGDEFEQVKGELQMRAVPFEKSAVSKPATKREPGDVS